MIVCACGEESPRGHKYCRACGVVLRSRNPYLDDIWTVTAFVSASVALCCGLQVFSSGAGNGSPSTQIAACALILFSAIAIIAAFQIKFRMKAFFRSVIRNVILVLYGVMGTISVISAGTTIFAVLDAAGDQVSSFLVAPVGTKPDHIYSGFGRDWELYLACSVASYILFRVLRVLKNAAKKLSTIPVTAPLAEVPLSLRTTTASTFVPPPPESGT